MNQVFLERTFDTEFYILFEIKTAMIKHTTKRTYIPITSHTMILWLVEWFGSTSPTMTLQRGQKWVNFLNPGRQITRQLAIHVPKQQQRIAHAHPLPEIELSTFVEICTNNNCQVLSFYLKSLPYNHTDHPKIYSTLLQISSPFFHP